MYKHKLPGVVRFFLALISIALCFVLFATTLVTILVADLRLVTSKESLQTIIMEILMPSSAPAARPGLAAGRPVIHYTEAEGGMQSMMTDAIMEMLKEQFGEDLPVGEEDINAFLADSSLPEYLSEKTADIVSGILTGETPTIDIPVEEVEELLKENAPALKEHFDIEITEEIIDEVGAALEENNIMEEVEQQVQEIIGLTPPAAGDAGTDSSGDEDVPGVTKPAAGGNTGNSGSANPVTGAIESFVGITDEHKVLLRQLWNGEELGMAQIPVALSLFGALTSLNTLLLCIGACLLIFLLMLLTHWGRPFAAVRTAGIPIMLAGGLMLCIGLLFKALPVDGMDAASVAVYAAISSAVTLFNYVSGGVAGLGLVMIIAGATLNSVFKKRAARKAAEAAAVLVSVPDSEPEDTFSQQLMDAPAEEPAAEEEEKSEEE